MSTDEVIGCEGMSLEKLLLDQHKRIYHFALREMGDPYDAEDIVSDVVLTALKSYDQLRQREKAVSWLWGIVRNVVARHRNKAFSRRESLVEESVVVDTLTVPLGDQLILLEEAERIIKALSYLANDYRKVMVKHYLVGKSYQQISGELAIPATSVTWRLSEGRRLLRREFSKMDLTSSWYEPQDMEIDIRYTSKRNSHQKSFLALDNLLAKNIALICYEKPLSVTDIASKLGVPAAYIEDAIAKMLAGYCLIQKANRYQTAFPIISEDVMLQIRQIAVDTSSSMYEILVEQMQSMLPEFKDKLDKTLTNGQALYLMHELLDYAAPSTPYDLEFEYPCVENEDKWVIKAFKYNYSLMEFPFDRWFVDFFLEDMGSVRLSLKFDANRYPDLWKRGVCPDSIRY